MWDGFNQRKFPRLKLGCEVVLQTSGGKARLKGLTENVGAGGICLIHKKRLKRFSVCKLHLELSSKLPPIECAGRVCWVIPRQDPKAKERLYDIGIEYTDLGLDDVGRLKNFIEEHLPKGFQKIM